MSAYAASWPLAARRPPSIRYSQGPRAPNLQRAEVNLRIAIFPVGFVVSRGVCLNAAAMAK